jgi:DNA-3-methyladenine glycosylase II
VTAIGPLDSAVRADRPQERYGALVRCIVGQQLSTLAARSIYRKVTTHFGDRDPSPQEVLATDLATLRTLGLSRAKCVYLQSLATHVQAGALKLELLDQLPDDEVVAQLTAVHGLGVWTAQMFLMFNLARPDVLPTGDLGIRKAVQRLYELGELPRPKVMEQIAEAWRPHRTLACRYLWRSLDATPVTS